MPVPNLPFLLRRAAAPLALAAIVLGGCNVQDAAAPDAPTGVVAVRVNLDRVGAVLARSAADTAITLDSLHIVLTSPGQTTQSHVYAISGDAASGNVPVEVRYFTLAALKVWKARIVSIDTTRNPDRIDTVHIDSVSFTVYPADTVRLSPTLGARRLLLRQRLVSNNPAAIPSGIRFIRLILGGAVVDSVSLGTGIIDQFFTSSSAGFGVGEFGVILRTTSGGLNWAPQISGTAQHLRSVFMATATTGWTVGDSGVILRTTNGGANWTAQTSGTIQSLRAVHGVSGNVNAAWAVGTAGVILNTTNGGTNWIARTSGTTRRLNAVFATAATVVWAAGDSGTLLKSVNGTTFNSVSSGTQQNLHAVRFAPGSSTQGWVAGAGGTLRKTLDSANWTPRASNTTQDLHALFIQSATSVAYAAGAGGTLLKTTDSSTWTAQASGTTLTLTTVQAFGVDSAFAAGPDAPFLSIANAASSSAWTATHAGGRGFDKLLAYKRMLPGVVNTLVLQAIDTTAGPLRGYEFVSDLNVPAGKDTTLTVNLLDLCGYAGTPACTVP